MDFLVICGIFFCLYGLSMTVLSDIYVLNWTAQNRYVYLWIPILLLVIFEQRLLSYILTVGNIIGIVIGQILGDYLMDYHHPGVFIWIEVVFFSLIIGILAKVIICWRKKSIQTSSTIVASWSVLVHHTSGGRKKRPHTCLNRPSKNGQ